MFDFGDYLMRNQIKLNNINTPIMKYEQKGT